MIKMFVQPGARKQRRVNQVGWGRPQMNLLTKFDLNSISGLCKNVPILLDHSEARKQ